MLAVAACNDASFKTKSDDLVKAQALAVTCNAAREYEAGALELPVERQDAAEAQVLVSGDFCPQAPAQLRVVFVVDFSLSMYNAAKNRGNDPVVDQRCGRLDAAKAIVDRYRSTLGGTGAAKTDVKVGVVSFSSGAETRVPLTSLADFKAEETVANFCQGDAGTNYKAGLDKTRDLLRAEPGTKVVFFISDGMPTEGGGGAKESAPRHREAATDAIEALREAVPNLTFNTVYLNNTYQLPEDDLDPQEFLEDFTGDKQRVKVVEKADKLAEEILKLESPQVALDKTTATAALRGPGGLETPVAVTKFEAASRTQVWSFTTAPFPVKLAELGSAGTGGAGGAVLVLAAKDGKGEIYRIEMPLVVKAAGESPSP
jgi:uncharacterized protein YegL